MCFSLAGIETLVIYVIVTIGVLGIIRILVPWLLSAVGGVDPRVSQIVNIILWIVVAVLVVKILFQLLSCVIR